MRGTGARKGTRAEEPYGLLRSDKRYIRKGTGIQESWEKQKKQSRVAQEKQ